MPPGVLLTDPAIGEDGSGLATNVFYSASLAAVFWDDRESLAEQMLIEAAGNGNHQMYQQEQQGEELGAQGPYGTNDFWLEPVSVVSNLFNAILHNTTNGSTYIISSTEAIDPVTNSVWLVEGSLQGGTNAATQFALGIALRTNNLFIAAQACDECTTNTLPLWWQLAYFGVTGVDPNGDYDCDGVTNLAEFLNNTDPNKILFSLSVTNEYVATTAVPVQVNIAGGVPSYIAMLLNDDSPANASWQPFTSTSLSVALPTNGAYVITVGLCGLATNATQSWQSLRVFRDTTPLTLGLTNLPSFSGSRPFIDPAGYASRALSALTWTLVNATGATNTGNGMVVAQGWSISDPWHATNWLQCVDLPLALGTNWVSIRAVDWAGSVALTNFNYVFDTNGDTTAPALSVAWPPAVGLVSGESFTVQATTDDDTAAVALQYLDGDGIVQTVSGLVERGGKVWVPDVPLAAGANGLTVLTTDAAGNVSTNNLTVVRTNLEFEIAPLTQDELKYAYATVWVTGDDWNAEVTVNGAVATNLGCGYWEAGNVALPPGGTVSLQATAQLGDGTLVHAMLTQERGPIVFTQTYGYNLDYSLGAGGAQGLMGHHANMQWARMAGGTNTQIDWWVNVEQTVVSSNVTVIVWPADNGYLPLLQGQQVISYYENGQLISTSTSTVDRPLVDRMEKSGSGGTLPENSAVTWTESSQREVRLFTGGNAARQQQGLFDLSAGLTWDTELDPGVHDWGENHPVGGFLIPAVPPVAVPSEDITLGALGPLSSDGHLWTVQPDGIEKIITPQVLSCRSALAASASPYVATGTDGSLPAAPEYKLMILCNGVPATNTPNTAVVGQKIALTCKLVPDGGPQITNYQWTIPSYAISNFVADVNTGRVFEAFSKTTSNCNFYWVDGGNKQVQCSVGALGATLSASAVFNVQRPNIQLAVTVPGAIGADTNYVVAGTYLHFGGSHSSGTNMTLGIKFEVLSTDMDGYMEFIQVGSAQASYLGSDGTNYVASGSGVDNGTLITDCEYHQDLAYSPATVADDSPACPLVNTLVTASRSDNFTMYLMFQSTNSGANIVPIKKVPWSWSASATLTNAPLNLWNLTAAVPPNNPTPADATRYPQWTNHIQPIQWSPRNPLTP